MYKDFKNDRQESHRSKVHKASVMCSKHRKCTICCGCCAGDRHCMIGIYDES